MNRKTYTIGIVAIILLAYLMGAVVGIAYYKHGCEEIGYNNDDRWMECSR